MRAPYRHRLGKQDTDMFYKNVDVRRRRSRGQAEGNARHYSLHRFRFCAIVTKYDDERRQRDTEGPEDQAYVDPLLRCTAKAIIELKTNGARLERPCTTRKHPGMHRGTPNRCEKMPRRGRDECLPCTTSVSVCKVWSGVVGRLVPGCWGQAARRLSNSTEQIQSE